MLHVELDSFSRNQVMGHGGARRGAGRKIGTQTKVSQKAREAAAKTGKLPHEILLSVSRGEPLRWGPTQEEAWPTPDQQIDAAKAAAPYYAPRLAQVEQRTELNAQIREEKTVDAPPQETREEWLKRKQTEAAKVPN